ncbi:MAG: NAD(P)/FAD-dependent oxidoreductase [Candidatus Neomarinimicrobiota bacterium]
MNNYDVIIVGAGVAGLIAAGRAAELNANTLVVEKMPRPGLKLLITGKGRCNITNSDNIEEFIKNVHPNGRILKHAFYNFFSKDIIALLHKYGVETVVERGGRIFPASNKSKDILNALVSNVKKYGVEFRYNCKVSKLLLNQDGVTGVEIIKDGHKISITAKKVILCTGGKSYPATGSTGDGYILAKSVGHTIEPPSPALVPIITKGNIAGQLQGLTLKNVTVTVGMNSKKYSETFGELLFTHFGLSGPIILTLSRNIVRELIDNNKIDISIDLKPALDNAKLDNRLQRDLNKYGKRQIDNLFKLWLPAKLISVFIKKCSIDPLKKGHQITSQERHKIKSLLKNFRLEVIGFRPFKEAIITAGGISTKEIEPKTMRSKLVKNLYFAGEVIDVDANTGGYNLQIAYSTGWLAAESCVRSIN